MKNIHTSEAVVEYHNNINRSINHKLSTSRQNYWGPMLCIPSLGEETQIQATQVRL